MPTNKTPIKRHAFLQPLSRDHHHTLLLVWKIRTALRRKVENTRVKKYLHWFYAAYLDKHLELEEKYLYPILGNDHPMIRQALDEHRDLRELIQGKGASSVVWQKLADLLEQHIRFEERTLFNLIQQSSSDERLQTIKLIADDHPFMENNDDKFWE